MLNHRKRGDRRLLSHLTGKLGQSKANAIMIAVPTLIGGLFGFWVGNILLQWLDNRSPVSQVFGRPSEPQLASRSPETHWDSHSLEPEMADIPAGSFCMGSRKPGTPAPAVCPDLPEDPDAQDNEQPVRRVKVNAFRMGVHEVTAGEFRRFVDDQRAHGRKINWTGDDGPTIDALPKKNHNLKSQLPAVQVSWEDAVNYGAWLSEKTGKKYRLPSEAEWEYAARAGTVMPRWWEKQEDSKVQRLQMACQYANVLDLEGRSVLKKITRVTWNGFNCKRDGYSLSAPVGSYPANAFKLKDMLGNVWEWVQDCYHPDDNGALSDHNSWVNGANNACDQRVIRGGSWGNHPIELRSAHRYMNTPGSRNGGLGFRLAQDIQ